MKLQREFRHGWSIVLAISLTLASVSCTQQSQESPNAECVTRLQLPDYPAIAQAARVRMTLTAAVIVANDGSAQSISFESISGERADLGHWFHGVLEQSLKASQFSTSCSGKTVRLIFDFRLGKPPKEPIWFSYPNRFEIWEVTPTVES